MSHKTEEFRKKMSEIRSEYCKTNKFKMEVRLRRALGKFSHWKGGTNVSHGYLRVRCDGHPRATKNGSYVFQHVLVMEKHIGRYLGPNEIVHHKNRNRMDNRLENLELMTKSEHAKHHRPTVRGQIITCAECGREKPMDSEKFHCCRWCYLKNHLGYAGKCSRCGEEKKYGDIKAKTCRKCVIEVSTGKPYEIWNKGKPWPKDVKDKISASHKRNHLKKPSL